MSSFTADSVCFEISQDSVFRLVLFLAHIVKLQHLFTQCGLPAFVCSLHTIFDSCSLNGTSKLQSDTVVAAGMHSSCLQFNACKAAAGLIFYSSKWGRVIPLLCDLCWLRLVGAIEDRLLMGSSHFQFSEWAYTSRYLTCLPLHAADVEWQWHWQQCTLCIVPFTLVELAGIWPFLLLLLLWERICHMFFVSVSLFTCH